jgi:hypothetical protein
MIILTLLSVIEKYLKKLKYQQYTNLHKLNYSLYGLPQQFTFAFVERGHLKGPWLCNTCKEYFLNMPKKQSYNVICIWYHDNTLFFSLFPNSNTLSFIFRFFFLLLHECLFNIINYNSNITFSYVLHAPKQTITNAHNVYKPS